MIIRAFRPEDIPQLASIWNDVVEEGIAFPQEECLSADSAAAFFASQSLTAAAEDDGRILGLYILHPNNVGRCGHIANSSYAVAREMRGKGIGRALVEDSLIKARELGFRVLQFNAVVRTNHSARHLYESLGFHPLGTIGKGFRLKDGSYEDICPYWREL